MGDEIDMLDLTQLPKVGSGTAEKMKEAGILSIMSVAVLTPGQMKDAAGGTEASARKIIQAARELCKLGYELGNQIEEKENSLKKIPTYCEPIDTLLGGGLELKTSLEAFGEFASGKTNLSHLLAVSAIKQFPNSFVIWIDTENTFKPSRIRNFCEGLGMDAEKVLKQIKVGRAVSSDHQILLTENIEGEIAKGIDVKLIVVDSVMNHFRAEYLGRGTLSVRQQMLNGYLHKLRKLMDMYELAVYCTNQVQLDPGCMFGSPIKAIGGAILGHFATTRVWILKGAQGSRVMKMVDSPSLPMGEARFMIKETILEGIEQKSVEEIKK